MYFIIDLTFLTLLFIYLFLINVKGHNSINIIAIFTVFDINTI